MSDWPEPEEVKQVLDVTSDDWDETIERLTNAVIEQVKADVGDWDEYEDEPTESLSMAALRLAEIIGLHGNVADAPPDGIYLRLIRGARRKFGIS